MRVLSLESHTLSPTETRPTTAGSLFPNLALKLFVLLERPSCPSQLQAGPFLILPRLADHETSQSPRMLAFNRTPSHNKMELEPIFLSTIVIRFKFHFTTIRSTVPCLARPRAGPRSEHAQLSNRRRHG